MAEQHLDINAVGMTTTPLALQGNFSIHISGTFKGLLVLQKKYTDQASPEPVKGGQFFRPDDMIGHEPEAGVEYSIKSLRWESGTAYVRLSDGN